MELDLDVSQGHVDLLYNESRGKSDGRSYRQGLVERRRSSLLDWLDNSFRPSFEQRLSALKPRGKSEANGNAARDSLLARIEETLLDETGSFGPGSERQSRPAANHEVRKIADEFNAAQGLPEINHDLYPEVDEDLARQVADAYDALEKFNGAPPVLDAYSALSDEIKQQWDFATQRGINSSRGARKGNPMPARTRWLRTLPKNKHLYFFTGGEHHPLLHDIDPATGVTQ